MPEAGYDPVKRHEAYLRSRQLKGRKKGSGDDPQNPHGAARPRGGSGPHKPHKASPQQIAQAQQRVNSIRGKLDHLRALLRQKQASSKSHSKSSDGKEKSTAAEKAKARQDSKEYYSKHKNEIKNDRKRKGGGSSGGKSYDDMSTAELKSAIRTTVVNLKQAVANARRLRGG